MIVPYRIADSSPFNRPLIASALSSRLAAPRAFHFRDAWENNPNRYVRFRTSKICGWRKERGISKQQRGRSLNRTAGFPLTGMRASTRGQGQDTKCRGRQGSSQKEDLTEENCLTSLKQSPPGSPGRSPAQGPHSPARADFPHAVLQAVGSLSSETFESSHIDAVHRYPSLFRAHSTGFHCTRCGSHRRFYGPMSPFPPRGPISSGSPASSVL